MISQKLICIVYCSVALSFLSYVSAQVVVRGIITDEETKAPIRGVSVFKLDTRNGTLSNEEGEFELIVDKLPVSLTFSHVSYKKMRTEVVDKSYKKIALPLAVIQLAEAQVGNPAIAILNAVIRKAQMDSSRTFYRKAFYQKTSQSGGRYTKIHESFMNVAWNTTGVTEWSPLSVRVAELEDQRFRHKNFLYATFKNTSIYKAYAVYPLNTVDITQNYVFRIEGYSDINTDDELVKISCKPKKTSKTALKFKGTIYVYTKYDALAAINGIYYLSAKRWKAEDQIDAKFTLDKNKRMLFDNIYLTHTSIDRLTRKKDIEKSWLYFNDEIPNLGDGKKYDGLFLDDIKIFNEVPYNAEYWKSNIPIKHTKIEAEVIKELGRKDQFKSNFN